jgi:hypothetical protein
LCFKKAQLEQIQQLSSKQNNSEDLFGWLIHFGIGTDKPVFLWVLNFLEECWWSKQVEQKISLQSSQPQVASLSQCSNLVSFGWFYHKYSEVLVCFRFFLREWTELQSSSSVFFIQ